MSYLQAFNNQIINFSKQLTILFPEDTHLKLTHNAIFLLKVNAPNKLYQMFNKFIVKYRNPISNRDETFFLSNTYTDLVSNDHSDTIINSLKSHWKEMNSVNKQACWDYFNVLFKLHDLISNEKNEN
jgi:hypothetical protein